MNCKDCNSSKIKVRKNYSHGKSSKAKTSMSCQDCGSTNIEMPMKNNFKRRR